MHSVTVFDLSVNKTLINPLQTLTLKQNAFLARCARCVWRAFDIIWIKAVLAVRQRKKFEIIVSKNVKLHFMRFVKIVIDLVSVGTFNDFLKFACVF
jgi:hypothetical protein